VVYKRAMRTLLVAFLIAGVGCGDDGGSATADGSTTHDAAPVDAPIAGADALLVDAPPMITVSGQAVSIGISGAVAEANVTIEAFLASDETTPIATTTTNANGDYALDLPTHGGAVDGFLKATKSAYKTTYLYPPYALTSNFSLASVIMVTPSTYDLLSAVAQGNQQPGKALVALIVTDGATPIAGATVTSSPEPSVVRYNASDFPSSTATQTADDGIAYLFNVPVGAITVSGDKPGLALKTHGLKAWPDQLTTTLVVP
jgi:hypothetical protein